MNAVEPSRDDNDPLAERLVTVAGILNLRHVGGYRTTSGSIRPRVLFRSAALHSMSDPQALVELGIATVIDLRHDEERTSQPSVHTDGSGLSTFHVPILTELDEVTALPDLRSIYCYMVDRCGPAVGQAIEVISRRADRPVLVHCTAGKDRTGVVVGLVLSLVGVSDEEIDADYAHSAALIEPLRAERLRAASARLRADGAAASGGVYGSPAGLLAETLQHVREAHGSIERYGASIGVDDDTIARLRLHLVDLSD